MFLSIAVSLHAVWDHGKFARAYHGWTNALGRTNPPMSSMTNSTRAPRALATTRFLAKAPIALNNDTAVLWTRKERNQNMKNLSAEMVRGTTKYLQDISRRFLQWDCSEQANNCRVDVPSNLLKLYKSGRQNIFAPAYDADWHISDYYAPSDTMHTPSIPTFRRIQSV